MQRKPAQKASSSRSMTSQFRQPDKSPTSNAGMTISTCLQILHKKGLLGGNNKWVDMKNKDIPESFSEKQKLRYTLELVQKVVTVEHKKLLGKPYKESDRGELLQVYAQLEREAAAKMFVLEDKDPQVEAKTKKPGQKTGSTYLAIGKRVKQHKNQVHERMVYNCKGDEDLRGKVPDPAKVELVALSEIPKPAGPGTPKGNKSIRTLFAVDEEKQEAVEEQDAVQEEQAVVEEHDAVQE